MIYDYYCVDCGNKITERTEKEHVIRFDLAELLGLRGNDRSGQLRGGQTQISADELKKLAKRSGAELVHGKRSKITITLREFLAYMVKNSGKSVTEVDQFHYSTLMDLLSRVYRSTENVEVAEEKSKAYREALMSRFVYFRTLRGEPDPDLSTPEKQQKEMEMQDDLQCYEAEFWVEPEFFEDGNSDLIYTVAYTNTEHAANCEQIKAPTEIRGYCPMCGAPVLEGAGKYEHVLIGLLGAQSAGKTSTIVAMLREIRDCYDSMGIKYPSVLCDSKYQARQLNLDLYEQGWAVKKTDKDTNIATFNASLLIKADPGPLAKIVTFIDIAGEQCYDVGTRTINPRALEVYPLINSCDIYLLCTCIDKDGYGGAKGISEDAVMRIAEGFYDNLREPSRVPPLGIILTKADMTSKVRQEEDSGKTPFDELTIDAGYLLRSQIENLRDTYSRYNKENIREPIRWAYRTYRQLEDRTYISLISTSALGRVADLYKGDENDIPVYLNEEGEEAPFRRVRLDILWKWILQITGIVPVDDTGYCFPYVPSKGESYARDEGDRYADKAVRRLYTVDESEQRCLEVAKMFLNPSVMDRDILSEWVSDLGLWERLRGKSNRDRVLALLGVR